MFGSLGITELLIIGLIAVIIFGPRQLPKMGKAFGETIREFRKIHKEVEQTVDEAKG